MIPSIVDGDVVTISPVYGLPAAGDVAAVVTSADMRLLVHRVISADDRGVITCGDNGPDPDGMFSQSQVIGLVTRIERDGRDVTGRMGAGDRISTGSLAGRVPCLSRGVLPGLRSAAGSAARALQSIGIYRRLFRRVAGAVRVIPAQDALGMKHVQGLPHVSGVESTADAGGGSGMVALLGRHVAGSVECVVHPVEHKPWTGHWLHSLVVKPVFRGAGVGEALVRSVVRRAADNDASEIMLAVGEDNERAIALYRKLGFERAVRPELEALLDEEAARTGRRRVTMVLGIEPHRFGGEAAP